MLDSRIRPLIDPPLAMFGRMLARRGVAANAITLAGLALGLSAAVAVSQQFFLTGFLLILASRLADGLDGAVARIDGATDFGGFLDIVADFTFYAAIPLAFALAVPEARFPVLFLLASFILSGTSFLASAIIAAKRGWTTDTQGQKSFYYLAGLAEGTETIGLFLIGCLWPSAFPVLASAFAVLCLLTAIGRILAVKRMLEERA